jgi:hypothetical protein
MGGFCMPLLFRLGWWMSGRRPGWMLHTKARASKSDVASAQQVELRLARLGWQPYAACVARLSARSARLRGGVLTFRSRRWPRMLVRRMRSTSSWSYAARVAGGCIMRRRGSSASGGTSGWRSRKVVLVVCLAWRSSWMSGHGPKHSRCLGHRPSVMWTTRLPSMLVVSVALAHLRGGLAFSSLFERPVPDPPIAIHRLFSSGGAWSVLHEWCF